MNAYILRRKSLGKTSTEAIQSLSTTGIKVYRNDQELPKPDILIRWGCTSNTGYNPITINQAKAIHRVADKAGFRKLLQDNHPEIVPKSWFAGDTVPGHIPIIVRPIHHAQGKNIKFIGVTTPFNRLVESGFYASEFIPKVAEYRVFIVSNRVVCVASKTVNDPSQIAWNVAQGGKFENVKWGSWPISVLKTSLLAFQQSGLDFGGVDIMVDADGKSFVLEINSACSLTSPYRQQCFTKAFDWIVNNGKDHFVTPDTGTHWSHYIHPAIH